MKILETSHHFCLCCFLLCTFTSMSYGFKCRKTHETDNVESCPTTFGNIYRTYCCEYRDGTHYCCDFHQYIRNSGERNFIKDQKSQKADGEFPWWLIEWFILYVVPLMHVCMCIICCLWCPCCKKRRRGFIYRNQQPTTIVNFEPYDTIPAVQVNMSVLPPCPSPVPMPVTQCPATSLPAVHSAPFTQHQTLSQDNGGAFDDPPPPYSSVVDGTYFKQVP